MIAKYSLIFLTLLSFKPAIKGQVIENKFGDTIYIEDFSKKAEMIACKNIMEMKDSIILRVWNNGKGLTFRLNKAGLEGEKYVYVFRNPCRNFEDCIWSGIKESYPLTEEECIFIENIIKENTPNISDYDLNPYLLANRDGGNTTAVEIKIGNDYIMISERLFRSNYRDFVDIISQNLKLYDLDDEFKKSFEIGYWYNWGGSTNIYYTSRFQEILNRLSFWK